MTISKDTPQAVQGIADAVEPAKLDVTYPDAAGAVINQHGFNLLWIGVVTTICAFFVWKRSTSAIFLAALVAGLADIGYFLFMDLGGHVNFVPGTLMTLICAAVIRPTIAEARRLPTGPAGFTRSCRRPPLGTVRSRFDRSVAALGAAAAKAPRRFRDTCGV